jgi:hypothetical protein
MPPTATIAVIGAQNASGTQNVGERARDVEWWTDALRSARAAAVCRVKRPLTARSTAARHLICRCQMTTPGVDG